MNPVENVVVSSGGNVTRGPDSIIVDNSDPEILYGKGWETDSSTMNSSLRPERPFNNTLHGAFVSTELTYNFTGSSVEVWVAGSTSLTCFIDGVKVSLETSPSNSSHTSQNPRLLSPVCTATAPPTHHSLKIMVNGTTKNPIWLDFIRYTPSNATGFGPIRSAVREFSLTAMRHHELLSEEWDNQGSYIASTIPGASLTFNFTGASVAGLGVYDNSYAHNSSVASYTMDGEDPVLFLIENLSSNEFASLSNQVLFQTPQYPSGQHQLQLLYYGSPETAPLLFSSLIVHNHTLNLDSSDNSNLTLPTTSIPTPSSTIPSSNNGTGSSGKKSINRVVPIASGSCALFVILCILALIYYRRRVRLHQLASLGGRIIEPFHHAQTRTTPGLIPSKRRNMQQYYPEIGNSNNVEDSPTYSRPSKGQRLLQTPALFRGINLSPPAWSSREQITAAPRRRPSLRLLVHQDSGIRLPQPESEAIVVEVPPTYTPA